jgi:hypothetical protein
MKKHQPRKLKLASETLRHLSASDIRQAMGRQDYQCPPDVQESSGGFSGMPIGYCDTISGVSQCP